MFSQNVGRSNLFPMIVRRSTAKKKPLWPLFMDGVQLPEGQSHVEEAVYFLPLSSQKLLVLILSTWEGRKVELTLEPPNGFEHGTPGLGTQRLNHQVIATLMDYHPVRFVPVVNKTFEKLVINVQDFQFQVYMVLMQIF